jgi:hypothetical protein
MVERELRLHEETVKRAQEHVGTYSGARRRSRGSRSSRVSAATAAPELMAVARRLSAARPGTRVRVLDGGTVLVENIPPRG